VLHIKVFHSSPHVSFETIFALINAYESKLGIFAEMRVGLQAMCPLLLPDFHQY
jgi:hypothetical protein